MKEKTGNTRDPSPSRCRIINLHLSLLPFP